MKLQAIAARSGLMILLLLVPLQARGQNHYRVTVIIVSNPETKIRISKAGVWQQLYSSTIYECVGFVNRGDQVVNAIRFRFTYVEANRHVAGSDTLERRGAFQPGAAEDVPQAVDSGALDRYHNCQHFRYPNNNIAFFIATVDRVEFADGTVWEDVHPTATPVASITP